MEYTPYTLKENGEEQIWSVRGDNGFRASWPSRQALEADVRPLLAQHWPGMSPKVRILDCNLQRLGPDGRRTTEPYIIYNVEIIIGGEI